MLSIFNVFTLSQILISNLNAKSLIDQASLAAMKVESQENNQSNKKGFTINCKLKI